MYLSHDVKIHIIGDALFVRIDVRLVRMVHIVRFDFGLQNVLGPKTVRLP